MVDDSYVSAKVLLLEHYNFISNKMNELKNIKSSDDYLAWLKENKKILNDFARVNHQITYLFDYDIGQFTTDDFTYELARRYIFDNIKELDDIIDRFKKGEEVYLNENDNEHKDTNVIVVPHVSIDDMIGLKNRYLTYLEDLDSHLPKC